jgi:hypothetical protein
MLLLAYRPHPFTSPIQNRLRGKLSWRCPHLKRIGFTDYSRSDAGQENPGTTRCGATPNRAVVRNRKGQLSERLLEVDPAIMGLQAKLRALKLKHNALLANTLEHQPWRNLVALFIHSAI